MQKILATNTYNRLKATYYIDLMYAILHYGFDISDELTLLNNSATPQNTNIIYNGYKPFELGCQDLSEEPPHASKF
jgi:hypothetical protein